MLLPALMADPITAIGLLASVVQVIDATIKTYKYINDVRGADKERANLAIEVINLVPLLTKLRYRVEQAAPSDPWCKNILTLGGATGPLTQFKRTMEELHKKLEPPRSAKKRIGKSLVWSFEKKEVNQLLMQTERFKTCLLLTLQNDHV